jgi:hypothetical protein
MAVTLAQAKDRLDVVTSADDAQLQLYVDAANTWVAARVSDTAPAPVVLGTLLLIEHWWAWPVGAPADEASFGGRGFAIPNRVKELLDPYLSATSAPTSGFPAADCWWPDAVVPVSPTIAFGR